MGKSQQQNINLRVGVLWSDWEPGLPWVTFCVSVMPEA